MDPIEVFREQAKTATALMMEQMNQWIDVCCEKLKTNIIPPPASLSFVQSIRPKTLPPPPVVYDYGKLFASSATVQPPKDKEEEDDDDFALEFSSEKGKKPKKRLVEDEEEHSGEIDEEEEEESFINDEPSDEEHSSSSSDVLSPVHRKMVPEVGTRSKRARKAPNRFSPSRDIDQAKRDDKKAERSGVSLGNRRITKSDKEEWELVRQKSASAQRRNKWFRSRWGDQLEMVIRAGLGRESENNAAPRALWDDIAETPNSFKFGKAAVHSQECAFCGAKRMCTWKMRDPQGKQHYMGVCCANLAKSWQAFQEARPVEEDLEQMDRLFEEVRKAHVEKGNYNKK
jgi:hypothetical protein